MPQHFCPRCGSSRVMNTFIDVDKDDTWSHVGELAGGVAGALSGGFLTNIGAKFGSWFGNKVDQELGRSYYMNYCLKCKHSWREYIE